MKTKDRQSFSQAAREEMVRVPMGKACCMLSEITALTQTSGHLAFRGGGWISVSYRLDHTGTARRLYQLLKKQLGISPSLHFTQTRQLGGRRTSVLTLSPEDTRTLLFALHMAETDENGQMHLKRTVPRHTMTRQCCGRAFLRGAFLGAGTVTDPEKGYHLEWKTDDEHLKNTLAKLLEKNGMTFRSYERRGLQVIYLKEAQQISDMLAVMGAGNSKMEMENIRIRKQLRAAATRAANCDEHNTEKMLDAGHKQAAAIRMISLKEGLFTLPPALRELARARVENPDMSLQELGESLDPPVSKSAVNHRIRRLMEIAGRIEREYTKGETQS